MATLALSLAGQFAGGLVGGPIGATIGRALGALAGSAIDGAIFGGGEQGEASGNDIRLQGASEGGAISRIYGWNRVGGNIIWATELERITGHSSGAKGGNSQPEKTKDVITANFAVAFCEGEVTHLGRVWADGEVLDIEGLNVRFYAGSATQMPDGLIAAKQGSASTPAYRGVCYMVFERLPLEQFGNRIPNISAELCRSAGDLEKRIKAVTVIPGATEFGYDPTPRVRILGPGVVAPENAHVMGQVSDWTLSIDELQSLCPNLEHVALVIAWFGDNLDCANCTVRPKVEGADRVVQGTEWRVSGISRAEALVVSDHDGGPAYGGTPSDNAVLAAIADLKARGLKVTLYPIILMDVPQGNGLTDPYTGGANQPSYPWRGRITCQPSPGQPGTPDKSVAMDAKVSAFAGVAEPGHFAASGATIAYSGPADWGYRRMILHYARLSALAGGVEALLIGSEMRGMTGLRRSATGFPFVDALADLAGDVRTIVGAGTKLTYAADWTEYAGFQPPEAPGDRLFHLDPLWVHSAINAIGIDNYMPLSDWRDGPDHPDAALAPSPHDLGYLQSNIAGGEGYDWYYASDGNRNSATRTPISDGAYGEPWVWRTKDLVNWWSHAHYNRVDGVRAASPTAWVPGAKPIWFTELGCGAVDKGSNLPSAFGDLKSAENRKPYFSSGAQDTMIQRQFLRAHHLWWQPDAPGFSAAHNPVSGIYGGRMVDPERIYLWTWDARPYPAFPNFRATWADGVNHATGHWLSGRLGALGAAEVIAAIASDYGTVVSAQFSGGMKIEGLQIEGVVPMRSAIEPLLDAADLAIVDRPQGLAAFRANGAISANITRDMCAATDGPVLSRKRPDNSARIGHLGLNFLDRQNAYLRSTATAFAFSGEGGAVLNSGLVIDAKDARNAAERALSHLAVADDAVEFSLPPSRLALEVGDLVEIADEADGPFMIIEARDGAVRRMVARAVSSGTMASVEADDRTGAPTVAMAGGAPLIYAAHLPNGEGDGSVLVVGAFAQPWPGEISLEDAATGASLTRLERAATIGRVAAGIGAGTGELWDNQSVLEVQLYNGHLASADELAVLAGQNRAAVERANGGWEIVGFAEAELVSGTQYQLTRLLRGLEGTFVPGAALATDARFMMLDASLGRLPVPGERLGGAIYGKAYAGGADVTGTEFSAALGLDPLLPLMPAHLRAVRDAASGDVALSWMRRGRRNGNSWVLSEIPLDVSPEAYRVEIFNGATLVRTMTVGVASADYLLADQTADFGSMPTSFTYRIAQISPTLGAGAIAEGNFDG